LYKGYELVKNVSYAHPFTTYRLDYTALATELSLFLI